MKLRFFIDRPVFSGVISVVIVLLGVIAMFSLPVEQYPDIAPPTINVWASYPGANAETVQKAVIVPLEEAINGVEDMTYMTSTASKFVFPASRLIKEYAAFMSEYPQKKIPFTTNCLFAERRLTSEEPLSASMLTRLPT